MSADLDVAAGGVRRMRQLSRQQAIAEAVMEAGSLRIEELAERFGISSMTAHRDLDDLEARGLLRKSRGLVTAQSTALVESSDVYRAGRQLAEKAALARVALEYVEPGQAIALDDSTSTLQIVPLLASKTPLTVITNTLTIIQQLRDVTGITLLGLGGQYYNWCSSFMGQATREQIEALRSDLLIMSTSAITDDIAFHQMQETVDVKRAMFDSASTRILLADHTKFERRALHAMLPLSAFDVVVVDSLTDPAHTKRLRDAGVNVRVARA